MYILGRIRLYIKLGLVIALLMLAVLIVGCSSTPKTSNGVPPAQPSVDSTKKPTNGLVQTSNGGGVTIDVEWRGLKQGELVLWVSMDTHQVDLDPYDLSKLAILRDADSKEYRPIAWNSAPGGHHRTGTLMFSVPESLSQGTAKYFELILRDTAGVKERVLKWELS